MKKILAAALSAALALCLAACGSASSTAPTASSAPAASSAPPVSSVAPSATSGTFDANGFQYITANQLKSDIEAGKELLMVDIQVEEDYNNSHIQGAIATHAFPVETDEEKALIEAILPQLEGSEAPVVIICPGGKKGAENTWAYLSSVNFDMSRVYILENGQKGWPFPELLEGAAGTNTSHSTSGPVSA